VKTASDIYSPVSGEITVVNQGLVNDPALVNSDPYGKGWFYQIKLTQPNEVGSLLGPADYKKQIGE
jgi:glycine cleavage system H protein